MKNRHSQHLFIIQQNVVMFLNFIETNVKENHKNVNLACPHHEFGPLTLNFLLLKCSLDYLIFCFSIGGDA